MLVLVVVRRNAPAETQLLLLPMEGVDRLWYVRNDPHSVANYDLRHISGLLQRG